MIQSRQALVEGLSVLWGITRDCLNTGIGTDTGERSADGKRKDDSDGLSSIASHASHSSSLESNSAVASCSTADTLCPKRCVC